MFLCFNSKFVTFKFIDKRLPLNHFRAFRIKCCPLLVYYCLSMSAVFPGDYSYLGTTLRQNDTEPMPSLSDVRQVVSLYAVLPLGIKHAHI